MATQPSRLVTDIGGTNARFALVGEDGQPTGERTFQTKDHKGVVEAARAFLDGRPIDSAVLVVAGPVESDRIALTNCPWVFSLQETQVELGVDELVAINDFVAQALAIPKLALDEVEKISDGDPLETRPIAVIGPGTGLGVAGLTKVGEIWRPIATEGGHVSFAPHDEVEIGVLRILQKRFGHVSNERLVSGPGLLNLALALAELDATPLDIISASDVVRRAETERCSICIEAIRRFCRLLGSAAGDLALSLGARGGVYLTGGMITHLGAWFDVDQVIAGFYAKGRLRSYLERIPLHRVQRTDTGLIGAASVVIG